MSVKVAVRVRPFNQRQKFLGCLNCIQMKERTTILMNPRDRSQKEHQFTFDYSFWSHDGFEQLENGYLYPIDDRFIDQKRIFKELGEDILKNAWNGFNICLFAYGQTGAGKSYSMIGYESNRGIVPMACQKIFENIERHRIKGKKQFEVTLSMLQIYNQKVQDLFMHTSKRPINGLKIRQSKKTGVYVEGISRFEVHSYAQIQRRMQEGAKNRSLASTLMNEYSSRAHTIVMIQFVQKDFITAQKINKKSSLLNLVDLAGSERIAKTGISDRDRLKEASQINKSLHTLGRVIEHLAEVSAGKQNVQIPYRQSALTRILETALGGNSMTTMICAISPANDNYEQTLSTLRYADQTKKIKNKPIINESAVDKIIRELREQNQRLKDMLRLAKLKGINLEEEDGNIFANMAQIQREIRKTMQSFAINTDNSEEDESMTISEFVDIPDPNDFYSGVLDLDTTSATTIGSRANAFITNLSEDRLLSFKIKYSCQQELFVGNKNLKEGRNKLILCGLGVEDRHARLYESSGKYYIEPCSEQAQEYTLVNGKSIDQKTEIFHNDRIIFGTNSVFLFKNFNQKGVKSPQKKMGSATSPKKKGIESNDIVSISPLIQRQSAGISVGTDDNLNESLLLDWDEQKSKSPTKSPSRSPVRHSASIQVNVEQVPEDIDQRLLDYQFAINQRQNKMFETSNSGLTTHNSLNAGHGTEMANKLQDIQKQFEVLKLQNQRKMKEKEQEFMAQLRRVEIQREIEKAKLREELKTKQNQAKRIAIQKERIQKIRDKLLQIQKQRKQKQRLNRQSMLLADDTTGPEQTYGFHQFVEVVLPPGNYKKKQTQTASVELNTEQINPPSVETRVEYVDRHHFHYDFNVIRDGNQILPNEDSKPQDPSVNTTSSNITNLLGNQDESMLLEPEQIKKNRIIIQERQLTKPVRNFTYESVYTLNETPQFNVKSADSIKSTDSVSQQKNQTNKCERKQSLNLTDILLDSCPPRKEFKKSESIEEQNLLNITGGEALANYLPPPTEPLRVRQNSGEDMSFNLSEDMTQHYQIREEELLQKIKQYQQKLSQLQKSAKQKKQSINNIRKSFVTDFGANPNSNNFYEDLNLFQGQLDLSLIQTRKGSQGSGQIVQQTEFEKKIRRNMVQCQNQNIINQRTLQVRKRKRQAEQLKQAFIKKQRKQLQKKLVELIPMLEKFNLWGKQMHRNIEGRIQIQYHNFTNYEIIDALKSSMKGKINIMVKIFNYEEGRSYKWELEVFQNRFQIAENLFERYLEHQNGQIFSDKSKDPFWDPRDYLPYAVGYLSLQSLSYALDYEGEVSIVYKGKIIGYLDVVLEPAIDRRHMKLRDKINQMSHVDEQIYDPRQLLEKDLSFTVSLESFRPTQELDTSKIEKYYFSYEILEDSYKKQLYKTQQINMSKKRIGYSFKHSLNNVTEHTLAYLADSPICITLNLLFQFDEEMSNLSSSFMQQSESSLNISSISEKFLKSEAGSSDSPPPFAKKKTTIILENPDVLSKIQESYSSEQIRRRQRAQTIHSSTKKKDKKEDCTIF